MSTCVRSLSAPFVFELTFARRTQGQKEETVGRRRKEGRGYERRIREKNKDRDKDLSLVEKKNSDAGSFKSGASTSGAASSTIAAAAAAAAAHGEKDDQFPPLDFL